MCRLVCVYVYVCGCGEMYPHSGKNILHYYHTILLRVEKGWLIEALGWWLLKYVKGGEEI
jgi:hypothetical protein